MPASDPDSVPEPPPDGPYDVFFSYATDDNRLLREPWGKQKTWAACFHLALSEAILMPLKRDRKPVIFIDRGDLRTGSDLVERIETALDKTNVLLAIASTRSFRAESWCRMERKHFIARLGPQPYRTGRVIPVLLQKEILSRWKTDHPGDVLAFHFYSEDPVSKRVRPLGFPSVDDAFLTAVNDLGEDIARILDRSAVSEPDTGTDPALSENSNITRTSANFIDRPSVTGVEGVPSKGLIVLGVVPHDMTPQRNRLADCLTGSGWSVAQALDLPSTVMRDGSEADELADDELPFPAGEPVPDPCGWVRRQAPALYGGNEEQLRQAVAFVQLLSPWPWQPVAFDHWQYEAAVSAHKPVFRFRLDTADLGKVPDREHAAWLQKDVEARSLIELVTQLPGQLELLLMEAALRRDQLPADMPVISLHAPDSPADETLAGKIADRLRAGGIHVRRKPDRIWFEATMREEDGLVIVFGPARPGEWLELALGRWRELLIKHQRTTQSAPPCAVYLVGVEVEAQLQKVTMGVPNIRFLRSLEDVASFAASVSEYAQNRPPSAA